MPKDRTPNIDKIRDWDEYKPYLNKKLQIQSNYPELKQMEREQWKQYFSEILTLTYNSQSFNHCLDLAKDQSNFKNC